MDKGIRPAANRKFAESLATRAEVGNTVFRKNIIAYLMDEFGITLASAATHYNHSFQECKKTNPELVVGLGRPEGKNNGGRKPKVVAAPVEAPAVDDANDAGETGEVQTVFTVKKKADGTVVAEGLNFEDATALVAKAKAAKKATLYFV